MGSLEIVGGGAEFVEIAGAPRRYLRDMLLGSVCSALCRPLDWRVSTIHGFAHLVRKSGRCLREEESVDQMLVPLFVFATGG